MQRFLLSEVNIDKVYSSLDGEMLVHFRLPSFDEPGVYFEISYGLKIVRNDPYFTKFTNAVVRVSELESNMDVSLANDICKRTGWVVERLAKRKRAALFVFRDNDGVLVLQCTEGKNLPATQRYFVVGEEQGIPARTVKSIVEDGRSVGGAWVSLDENTAMAVGLSKARRRPSTTKPS
jgi:hypothetical protein